MKTKFPLLLAIMLVVGFASACRTGPVAFRQVRSQTLVFSLAAGEESSWYKGATRFAEIVKQRTNGRFFINVFPRALLTSGDQIKELEMLQEGKIDLTYTSSAVYSSFDQQFSVMTVPWMFTSDADVDRLLKGPEGQKMLTACDRVGVVGLALGENGFEQITNSKREIMTPTDLRGLKIGLHSANVDPSIFSKLGAAPRWLNASEAYSAMQSGIVDGQKSGIGEIVTNRLYQVQKYMTIWNYSYSPIILGMNKKVWADFDADMQEVLRKAAEEASDYQVQENRKETEGQLQLLKSEGMMVTVLSPDQIQAFRDVVPPSNVEYESAIGRPVLVQFAKEKQ